MVLTYLHFRILKISHWFESSLNFWSVWCWGLRKSLESRGIHWDLSTMAMENPPFTGFSQLSTSIYFEDFPAFFFLKAVYIHWNILKPLSSFGNQPPKFQWAFGLWFQPAFFAALSLRPTGVQHYSLCWWQKTPIPKSRYGCFHKWGYPKLAGWFI